MADPFWDPIFAVLQDDQELIGMIIQDLPDAAVLRCLRPNPYLWKRAQPLIRGTEIRQRPTVDGYLTLQARYDSTLRRVLFFEWVNGNPHWMAIPSQPFTEDLQAKILAGNIGSPKGLAIIARIDPRSTAKDIYRNLLARLDSEHSSPEDTRPESAGPEPLGESSSPVISEEARQNVTIQATTEHVAIRGQQPHLESLSSSTNAAPQAELQDPPAALAQSLQSSHQSDKQARQEDREMQDIRKEMKELRRDLKEAQGEVRHRDGLLSQKAHDIKDAQQRLEDLAREKQDLLARVQHLEEQIRHPPPHSPPDVPIQEAPKKASPPVDDRPSKASPSVDNNPVRRQARSAKDSTDAFFESTIVRLQSALDKRDRELAEVKKKLHSQEDRAEQTQRLRERVAELERLAANQHRVVPGYWRLHGDPSQKSCSWWWFPLWGEPQPVSSAEARDADAVDSEWGFASWDAKRSCWQRFRSLEADHRRDILGIIRHREDGWWLDGEEESFSIRVRMAASAKGIPATGIFLPKVLDRPAGIFHIHEHRIAFPAHELSTHSLSWDGLRKFFGLAHLDQTWMCHWLSEKGFPSEVDPSGPCFSKECPPERLAPLRNILPTTVVCRSPSCRQRLDTLPCTRMARLGELCSICLEEETAESSRIIKPVETRTLYDFG